MGRARPERCCEGRTTHGCIVKTQPIMDGGFQEILRAAVTARDEIQNMGFVPEALDRHMNTLRRIAQSDKIFADCAFTSNAQERRFSRNGVELLHAISASLEAL